ncbi:hypothetical protein RSK60_1610002 [Ralstonia solanacearum K60]|nr:hypothetical protein RSK60_1610002 [Ralstonia solanacearum K60]
MSREDILRRLADITPDQLSAYLTLRGWSNDGSIGSLASIWHRPEPQRKDVEILLPIAVHAKDFKDHCTMLSTRSARMRHARPSM